MPNVDKYNPSPQWIQSLHKRDCLILSERVLRRAQAHPVELEHANRDLREYLGLALSSFWASAYTEQLKPLYATVLEHAEGSWASEQKWDLTSHCLRSPVWWKDRHA